MAVVDYYGHFYIPNKKKLYTWDIKDILENCLPHSNSPPGSRFVVSCSRVIHVVIRCAVAKQNE